jgi:PPOX class probable F420-dependent enzyme
VDRAESLALVAAARSGHLATVTPGGHPHVVVVTFALSGDSIVTPIDDKPKSSRRLQRLVNVETTPLGSFLVDGYDEDWTRLWWVRIDGTVSVHEAGVSWRRAIDALSAKYAAYREKSPTGPVISIETEKVTSWSSTR